MKFILIDESAARELLEAVGKEFIHYDFEKVHRLLGLCSELVSPPHVGDGHALFGDVVRNDTGVDVRNSVRIVSVSHRDGRFVLDRIK